MRYKVDSIASKGKEDGREVPDYKPSSFPFLQTAHLPPH